MSSFIEICQLEQMRQEFFYDIKEQLLARTDTDQSLLIDIASNLPSSIFNQLISNDQLMEFLILRVECLQCHNHFFLSHNTCIIWRFCESCLPFRDTEEMGGKNKII